MTRIAIERAIRSPFSGQPERYNRRPSISCEFYVSTWARWVVAAGIAIYVLSLDVCLLLGAPVSPSRSPGELALGLIIQSACLVAISRLIVATTSYFKFVHDYLKGGLRAFALIGPLVFLLFSTDMVALGLNGRGNDRLENSRLVGEALGNCCPSGKVLSALRP